MGGFKNQIQRNELKKGFTPIGIKPFKFIESIKMDNSLTGQSLQINKAF